MSREYRLQKLLKNPHIWRPGDFSAVGRSNVPSGFAELDRQLGGGWPVGVLTELLLSNPGIGELGLLLPALLSLTGNDLTRNDLTRNGPVQDHAAGNISPRRTASAIQSSSQSNRLVWIAPPYIPYAPALTQYGLDISQILVVQAAGSVDTLWAMEQALRSSVCIAVLGWLTDVDDRSLRRLQLAAESAACWAVIFRPERFTGCTSPAPLRVHIKPGAKPEAGDLDLQLLRNRYGPVGSLSLQC